MRGYRRKHSILSLMLKWVKWTKLVKPLLFFIATVIVLRLLYFPRGNKNRIQFYIKVSFPFTQLTQWNTKLTDAFLKTDFWYFQFIKIFFLSNKFYSQFTWKFNASPYSHHVVTGRNIFSKYRLQNEMQKKMKHLV